MVIDRLKKYGFFEVFAAAVVIAMTFFSVVSVQAFTGDKFLVDRSTGYALFGYDPVAYFTDMKPVAGKDRYTAEWEGVIWKFASAANRDRFADAPKTYAPIFGGYGAFAVSNGFPAEGNPLIWAIFDNRLFLFHSVPHRRAWAAAPIEFTERAKRKWPDIQRTLTN